MIHTVIWTPRALQLLAAVWFATTNRNAVTHATHEIDNVLEMFPTSAGEVVFDTVREFSYPPLTVEFEVDDANHRVFVLSVWDTANGRPAPTGN